jgi:hypothetical protein
MSEQALDEYEVVDVYVIAIYPTMIKTAPQDLVHDAERLVFESEELAREFAAKATEKNGFWGFDVVRKSLLKRKQVTILKMAQFRTRFLASIANPNERNAVTDEDIGGLYADYFKSGNNFDKWLKENRER